MIKCIDRETFLRQNEYFAYTILKIQDGKYNPDNSPYLPGEMIETPEGTIILNENDCIKYNREAQYEFQSKSDQLEIQDFNMEYVDELVYGYTGKVKLKDFFDSLASTFDKVLTTLQWDEITFMMDYKTPWVNTTLVEEEMLEIQKMLQENNVSADFNGALSVKIESFNEMLPMLFWYGRFNDVFPEIYFTGPSSKTTFNICPFSNIHVHCFDQETLTSIKKTLDDQGLKKVKNDQCEQNYVNIRP